MPADLSDWLGDGRARSRRSFFWNEGVCSAHQPFLPGIQYTVFKTAALVSRGHVIGSLNGTLVYIMGISGTSRSPRQDI